MLVPRFAEVWEPFSSEAFTGVLGLWRGEPGRAGRRRTPLLAVSTPGQDKRKETCWSLQTKTEG